MPLDTSFGEVWIYGFTIRNGIRYLQQVSGYFRPLFGDLPRPERSLDDRLIEIGEIE